MTPASRPWWKTGVIYQIYPRSFQDSNGDGIGDLPGVISRLDYLQDLGIDAIWLSPIYPSPMFDFGYDVSDYTAVSPEFGTMAGFKKLLSEAHSREIRIIMDLVLNHTSHEHAWFRESSSSRDNPKREWYIWHDGKAGSPPKPPNNWQAVFGGRAWTWHPGTAQFYLHSFLKEQPDVNWRNPELQEVMWEVIRFWLDLGVDGFRLDVVNCFVKDDRWRDNPRKLWGIRPYDWQHHLYDLNRPETLEIVKQIRALVDQYPERMTVGEVMANPAGDPELAAAYYGDGQGLHMAFNFAFLFCRWGAKKFAAVVDEWELLLARDGSELWPNYVLSNHDFSRSFSRYGKKADGPARARVAAAMLLTLRGTPFIYYGEEIGMNDGRISRKQLQDPLGKRYWPLHPGRDPVRTPMQWDSTEHAGFSPFEPWLPVNGNYPAVNVAAQLRDPDSLLSWYRALIRLRRAEPALHSGAYRRLSAQKDVYCYERWLGNDHVLVALNFAAGKRELALPGDRQWEVLLGTYLSPGQCLPPGNLSLLKHSVLITRQVS